MFYRDSHLMTPPPKPKDLGSWIPVAIVFFFLMIGLYVGFQRAIQGADKSELYQH